MARRYAWATTVSTGAKEHLEVAVIGAGVVGCAVALELARRGVEVALLEAEPEPGLGASGTNSGILHTGFDSEPGALETELILRSARLRDEMIDALAIPVLRCGAVMRAGEASPQVAARAGQNGVPLNVCGSGVIEVPGESVTDPVVYTLALAAEAVRQGAELETRFRVGAIERSSAGLVAHSDGGESVRCRVAVNCAGLEADSVARLAGDQSFEIFPRKGEFLVFDPPGGMPLERILLPVPSRRTKGVLVFPTLDGKIAAGPTAVDLENKRDWSVRPEASDEIMPKAIAIHPPLEGRRPVASYAGLRPAGRGVNYLIGPSAACRALVNVAAIRSTGLTASLGIAGYVAEILESLGITVGGRRELLGGPPPGLREPWWRRTAEFRALGAA
jgi:glycerol-3-phosphate dehydrogenase